MQKICFKITFALISVCLLCLSGCGSDNYGGDYTATLSFKEGSKADYMTFDMVRDQCDVGDLIDPAGDVFEDFYDVLAVIVIKVSQYSTGLTLNGYTIEYLPELSEDGSHNLVLPPALNNLYDMGSNSIYIPKGSSSTITITCLTMDQKQEYRGLLGWTSAYSQWDSDADGTDDSFFNTWSIAGGSIYSQLFISRYTIRIILYGTDDNGEGQNIEIRRTVYFGNYDNC